MMRILPIGPNRRGVSGGFSLVEVLVVLSLAATTAAAISYVVINPSDRLADQAAKLVQQLKLTQQLAIREGLPQQVRIDLDSNQIEFVEESIVLAKAVSMTIRTSQNQFIDSKQVGISFYPDGSSSGGVIELENEIEKIEVSIVWISGKIHLQRTTVSG